jgi:hypothetical protein
MEEKRAILAVVGVFVALATLLMLAITFEAHDVLLG